MQRSAIDPPGPMVLGFDPVHTVGLSLLIVVPAAAAVVLRPGPWTFTVGFVWVVSLLWLLSRRDASRRMQLSMVLRDCVLLEPVTSGTVVSGVCMTSSVSTARRSRRGRFAGPVSLPGGVREVVVVCAGVVEWLDGSTRCELSGIDEIIGALSVVTTEGPVSLEILVAAHPRAHGQVLATRFFSSRGAVQSVAWDAFMLDPVFKRTMRVFRRRLRGLRRRY